MNPYSVIVRPLLSEKADEQREQQDKYSFFVQTKAGKNDVKKAVEALFDVNVTSVRTSVVRGKTKRRGMHSSLRSSRKKAMVTLKKGQKIEAFEN